MFSFIFIFLVVSSTGAYYATNWFVEIYQTFLVNKANDIALITSNQLKITDEDVKRLKQVEFKQLNEESLNISLSEIFRSSEYSEDLKKVYVITKLEDYEIKYRATEEDENNYNIEVGDYLNYIKILDVDVAEVNDNFVDKKRYIAVNSNVEDLYQEKLAGNEIYSFDKHTTAYVPIYTVENSYIGLVCVDIHFDSLNSHISGVSILFTVVFLLPTLFLGMLCFLIYRRYVNMYKMSSFIDLLTSIHNRNYFDIFLPKIFKENLRNCKYVSLIKINIDNVGKYNDSYGRQKGDELIIAIANVVKDCANRPLDIVSRYNNEEFVVLLSDTNLSGALTVASNIKTAVSNIQIEHKGNDNKDVVTVSQGIYSGYVDRDLELTTNYFLAKSGKALIKAKEEGKNIYAYYDDDLDEATIR